MRRATTLLASLAILTAGGLLPASPARAAEYHLVRQSPAYPGSPAAAAKRFLEDSRARFDLGTVNLTPGGTLALGRVHHTVRFSQHYAGLPVLGAAAAVRVDDSGKVSAVVLSVARGLVVPTLPVVRATMAGQRVANHLQQALPPRVGFLLAVLPGQGGHLVWQVDVPTGHGGLRYLIDAHRGTLISWRPLAVHALGRIYPISSVVTPATQDIDLPDLDTLVPQYLTGWNGQLVVTNYVSGGGQAGDPVVEQTLVPNVGPDFLYDPPVDTTDATDGFAQVSLYYHLTRMRQYFETTFGVDFSTPRWALTAVANYHDDGQPSDNAFFSPLGIGPPWDTPNLIGVGQGQTFDFAQDSDVFLHEFGHYVSEGAVGYNEGQTYSNTYGISPFAGAIDEGIADYFACTENDDSFLGEASLALLGSGRDLTDTSKTCPFDVFGEVHFDGEIIASFSWTVREALGKPIGDQLVWGAMSLLTSDASLGDFARGMVQTANDLVTAGQLTAADVQLIQDESDARGLTGCDHELLVTETSTQTIQMFGLDLFAAFFGGSCQNLRDFGVVSQSLFHFRVEPLGGSGAGLRVRVDMVPEGGNPDFEWFIYGRAGTHVGFGPGQGFLPEVNAFDYRAGFFTDPTGELVIDDTSNPPFDPAETYYFAIAHSNCPNTEVTVSAAPVPPQVFEDAGVPDGGGEGDGGGDAGPGPGPKSGCGCQGTSGGSRAPLPLFVFGLFLLVVIRRARR